MMALRNWKAYLTGLSILLCFQMTITANSIAETMDPIPELADALSGEDAVARFMAEERLVEMGDASIPFLKPIATSSGFAPARQYAVNILARIGNERAIDLLLNILEQEPEVKVRALICRHLGRMGVEEAVPIIGKWLYTIQGKSFSYGSEPRSTNTWYAWIVHVHALHEIGSENGIPILEKMIMIEHGGRAGSEFTKAYQESLIELKQEAAFWTAVRQTPGLENHARLLFQFFRRNTFALIRLYRDKVIHLGLEGRWALEDMRNHPDAELRQAAISILREYERLKAAKNKELGASESQL